MGGWQGDRPTYLGCWVAGLCLSWKRSPCLRRITLGCGCAYLGCWAGRAGCLQWSWEAMRLRMTAEEVSMPAAPNAAMGSVAASAMRTSTERRWCNFSRQSANSSVPARASREVSLLQSLAIKDFCGMYWRRPATLGSQMGCMSLHTCLWRAASRVSFSGQIDMTGECCECCNSMQGWKFCVPDSAVLASS